MEKISLPSPAPLSVSLEEALAHRASFTQAYNDRPWSRRELGTLLGHALKVHPKSHRPYPSGGALYPVEIYFVGDILEDHVPSVFHYHPTLHVLEKMWELRKDFHMSQIFRTPATPLTSAALVFTAVWDRSADKYGDWAYHLAFLEAGHIAQNILLTATAMRAEARPVGGFHDDTVSEILDIDTSEQPVYSILLSPPPDHADA